MISSQIYTINASTPQKQEKTTAAGQWKVRGQMQARYQDRKPVERVKNPASFALKIVVPKKS